MDKFFRKDQFLFQKKDLASTTMSGIKSTKNRVVKITLFLSLENATEINLLSQFPFPNGIGSSTLWTKQLTNEKNLTHILLHNFKINEVITVTCNESNRSIFSCNLLVEELFDF